MNNYTVGDTWSWEDIDTSTGWPVVTVPSTGPITILYSSYVDTITIPPAIPVPQKWDVFDPTKGIDENDQEI